MIQGHLLSFGAPLRLGKQSVTDGVIPETCRFIR
jgi:hypothetical protein